MGDYPLWKHLKDKGTTPDDLLRFFGLEKPEIPVVGMAKGLGVEVYYRPNAGWDGMLVVDPEKLVARIFVEKHHSETRRRFTVAHELGHLMLHPDLEIHRDTAGKMNGNQSLEREANQFAADLLMPQWMVEFAFYRMSSDVKGLAELFNVSQEAMYYRLENIGIL